MALRKELRERKRIAEEQEAWILAYWSEEESISAHKECDVVDCTTDIGASCTVAFGRKSYIGKVAATGSKTDMLKLVDQFYEGVFTPFEVRHNDGGSNDGSNDGNADDQSVLPSATSQNSNIQSVATANQNEATSEKSTVEDKPKKKRKRKPVNMKEDTKTPRKDKRKKHHSVRKNKENQDPKKSSKSTSRSTVKGKKKGSGILTTGSGKGDSSESEIYISDQPSDTELEGWSDYILADEMRNDVCYENDEGTEQQPNDTTIHMHKKQDDYKKSASSTCRDENETLALKARLLELEAKHAGVQNQMFEMECKLLKSISDNKLYVVRKIRELSQAIKLNATGGSTSVSQACGGKPNGTGVLQACSGMSQNGNVPIVTGNSTGVSQTSGGMCNDSGVSQACGRISQTSNVPIVTGTEVSQGFGGTCNYGGMPNSTGVSEACGGIPNSTGMSLSGGGMSHASNLSIACAYPPSTNVSSFEDSYCEDETETGSNSSDSYINWQHPPPNTCNVNNRRNTARSATPQILLPPDDVVSNYIKLKNPSTMARLSVKLAREAFFGVELMSKCTVAGQRGFDSLPEAQLYNLKLYLVQLFPLLNRAEFEDKWKDCLISIGQACKSIRSKN